MLRATSRVTGDPWAVLPDSASAEEEEAADKAYEEIRAACRRIGAGFTDATFPPSRASLGTGGTVKMNLIESSGRNINARVPVVWRRPKDVADENGNYFEGMVNSAPSALKRRATTAGTPTLIRQDSSGDDDSFEADATDLKVLVKFANTEGEKTAVPWHLRSGFFQPEDVVQGQLGTCWFVSAIAVVAERRDLMLRLFRDPPQLEVLAAGEDAGSVFSIPANPYGCYQIRLCIDGLWRIVTIDDHIPANGVTGEVAYTSSARRQLWAPLLEKAAAKLVGSYGQLAAGNVREGLQLLTGARTAQIILRTNENADDRDERRSRMSGGSATPADAMEWEWQFELDAPAAVRDALWAKLMDYYKAGYPMGAACCSATEDDILLDRDSATAAEKRNARLWVDARNAELERKGLVTDHAYSVMDLHVAPASGTRLVRIRNPWSAGGSDKAVWKGAWADDSAMWDGEPGLRERLGAFMQHEGGIFWMSLEDFMRYFERLDVAYAARPDAGTSVTRVVLPLLRPSDAEVCVIQVTPLAAGRMQILAHQQPRVEARHELPGTTFSLAGGIIGAPHYVRDSKMYDHDLGIIVATESGDAPEEAAAATGLEYVGGAPRDISATISADVPLDAAERPYYIFLPTFNRYAEPATPARRKLGGASDAEFDDAVLRTGTSATAGLGCHFAVVALQSSVPVLVEVVRKPIDWMARAVACMTLTLGESALSGDGLDDEKMLVRRYDEGAGPVHVAANLNTRRSLEVTIEMDSLKNLCHSRAFAKGSSGADDVARPRPMVPSLRTNDVLSPRTFQVLAVTAKTQQSCGWSFSISAGTTSAPQASKPAVTSGGFHAPMNCK